MKLNIEGNVNRYYAQTLCMVFFPGAKFSETEQITPETPIVNIECSTTDEGTVASVEIIIGEKKVRCTHTEPADRPKAKIDAVKVAVGAAFFRAGEKFFKYTPAWGILTGVRPSKIAAEMFDRGMSVSETKAVMTKQYFVSPKKAMLLNNIVQTEAKKIKLLPEKSCSVYISIPFCPSRCSYCSFVSYSTKRLLSMIPDYIESLIVDIREMFDCIRRAGMTVSCVYIGGGTPTILDVRQLKSLLTCIAECVDPSTLLEYTLEGGRPDTINTEKLRIANGLGVTRVSINPQTLNNSVLETIGRKHSVKDFYRAYDIAQRLGIKCINTDLIAGLPGESFSSFAQSVDSVIQLHPQNITFHTFCVKRASDILQDGNPIYSRSGGDAGKSVDYAQVEAKNAGYIPYYIYRQKNTVGNYENVGFSLPGYEGLYNIYMMEEVHSIFAVGAGAVTKMMRPDREKIERVFMPKYPYEYLSEEYKSKKQELFFDKIREYYK